MSTSPIVDPAAPARAPRGSVARLNLRLDPVLILAVVGLGFCSVFTIDQTRYASLGNRQAIFFAMGGVIALLISQIDYSRLRELKWALYGLMIFGIVAVLVLGGNTNGTRRAIQFGFAELQFSEFGKVLLMLVLAAFLVDRARALRDRQTTARTMLVALAPTMLVLASDLGSGLVYVVIAFATLFVAGTSGKHFVLLFGLGALAITLTLVVMPKMGVTVLHTYQTDRLTSFLHPSDDPAAAGYQQNQSVIAIGSGERTGRGAQATQTTLKFLPEEQTDFVFAVVGEHWGFAGAGLVLSLYALLCWRALRILTMAKNLFGAIVAGAIMAMVLFQVFINVGMNVGIMPITGIPLPLMSYGGSSVLTTLIAVGLLQSIHVQARTARKGLNL